MTRPVRRRLGDGRAGPRGRRSWRRCWSPGPRSRPAPDCVHLGARCRVGRLADRPRDGATLVVLLEPSTEGRLAATLARHGEGWCATWLDVPDAGRRRRCRARVGASAPVRSGRSACVLGGPSTARTGCWWRPLPSRMTEHRPDHPPGHRRRRRGHRRAVHRRGLSGRPERHRRAARAVRVRPLAGARRRARRRGARLRRPARAAAVRARRPDRPDRSPSSSTPAPASAVSVGR